MHRIKLIITKLLFAVCLLITAGDVYATDDPEIVRIFSQAPPPPGTVYTPLLSGNTDELIDDIFYGPDPSVILNPANDKITNVISLLIREADIYKIKTDFTASVKIKIEYTLVDGSTGIINSTILNITYTKAGGLKYNARQTIKFDQCRRVKITILEPPVASVTSWNVWEVINLENRMLRKRDYVFNYNSTLLLAPPVTTLALDELIVDWSSSTAASAGKTHIDVEWTWIDVEALNNYKTLNPNNNNLEFDANLIFKNNASRITLESKKHNTYNIPIIYDGRGQIFYRVRPVQLKEDEQVINGTWSAEGFTGITTYAIADDAAEHVRGLNWQTTTSFAEEGKRKTVVQYFDGTLRGRQTVTKDNVSNKTVVAESFYDFQGRPTINILPAPTMSTVIKYTADFNKFLGGYVTPKEAFDLMPVNINACSYLTPKLDNTSGAAQYYSTNNLEKNSGFNKFIPDADGYAYTETRYTPDATGRIEAQGGVGETHQLGKGYGVNDHDTKYFYGKPDQDELDALFGTEAGDAAHYSKNMVRDANGQYSVSYVDMHGRTVATALAGTPPANVKALSSYVPVKPVRAKNLLSPTNNIIQGRSVVSSSSLTVSDGGPHSFHYELSPLSAEIIACQPAGQTVCYDCYYDLEIRITGGCGINIVKNATNLSFNNGVPVVDQSCSTQVAPIVVNFTETLAEGEYNITKTLTVNKQAQDWYRDNVYNDHNICKKLEDFYDEIYQQMAESSECIICNDCVVALPVANTAVNNNSALTSKFGLPSTLAGIMPTAKNKAAQNINSKQPAGSNVTNEPLITTNDECFNAVDLTVNPDYNCGIYTSGSTGWATPSNEPVPSCLPLPNVNEIKTDVWYKFTATNAFHRVSFPSIVASGHAEPIITIYSGSCGSLNELNCSVIYPYTTNLSGLTIGATYYIRVGAYLNPNVNFIICIGTPPPPVCPPPSPAECISVCDQPKNTLDAIRELMMDDMTPDQGQYARLNLDANDDGIFQTDYDPYYDRFEISEQRDYNIFKTEFSNYRKPFGINELPQSSYNYYDEDGIIDPDGESAQLLLLTPDKFSDKFKPSWAKQLLPYHPEYCKLKIAETQLAESYKRDAIIEATDTWADAYNAGFIENLEAPGDGTGILDLDQFFNCGNRNNYRMKMLEFINTNFNQYLVQDQTTPPYLSLWKIAWLAVFCDDRSVPAPAADCAFNAPLKPAAFPTYFAGRCAADKDQVWRIYRTLFLSEKERMVNEWLDTQCQDIDYTKIDGAAGNHYERRFGKPADYYANNDLIKTLINGATTTSDDAAAAALAAAEYMENCKSYKTAWITSLRECPTIRNLEVPDVNGNPVIDPATGFPENAFITTILNNLVNICAQGSDETHPMGSSSVKPGAAFIPSSFQAAFNDAWENHFGSLNSQTIFCHENLIDFPQPYGKQSPISNETIDEKRDQCICDRLLELNQQKAADGYFMGNSPNTSLSAYLLYKHGVVIRQTLVDSLQFGCDNTNCNHYEYPVEIPAILSCENPINNCVECIEFRALLTEFKAKYSALSLGAIYANPANDDELAANKALAKFINNKTGLTKSWGEYMAFNNQFDGDCVLLNTEEGVFTADPPKLCHDIMFPDVEIKDSCNQYVPTLALNAAIEQYQLYLINKKDEFENTYLSKCLEAKDLEIFTVTAPVSEYHYTLYYYDQAGNLVKTVPPAGVQPNFTPSFLAAVKTARANDQDLPITHNLPTQYRYNALNQVTTQKSPDGGQSQFWYDILGRLVVSQNAKQLAQNKYSYTRYDELGRIKEVGEKNKLAGHAVMTQATAQNTANLLTWLAATNSEPNKDITKTVYDEVYDPICAGNYMCQKNLRNRVSYTYVQAVENAGNIIPPWETATFYTYDIHGNVDVLLQDYKTGMGALPGGNRYKKITYKYDLISGKVNEVAYQPGYADAFYHRYEYDAENKLTETKTSKEYVYWETEASYKYYRHGPLARTVLGELEVQGVDYAYTLQGWLKGVNSTGQQTGGTIGNGEDCGPNSAVENLYVYNRLSPYPQKYVARTSVNFMPSTFESNTPDNFEAYIDPLLSTCEADGTAGDEINSPNNNAAFDMGQDGKTNATGIPVNTTNPDVYGNNIRTTDAYGYSLNYFNGDYNRIDQSAANPFAALNMPLPTGDAATPFTGNQLFNGNIGAMVVGIPKLGAAKVYAYNYDQLNRITNMFAFNGLNGTTNTFTPIAINDYKEAVTYDANGNILTYKRNGVNAPVAGAPGGLNMDDLAYEYIPNSNKLKRVTDNPAYSGNYPDDIDTQTDAENYVYDEIGNLIQDKAEGINSIEWTVYGKISKIIKVKPAGTTTITYTYDASGNRISKNVVSPGLSKTTYYVRDASGNVMSVYENGDATVNTGQLTQTELHMYGSSRLGVYNVQVNVQTESRTFINMPGVSGNNAEMFTFTRGNKFFELSNHLGNVLVTISDKKIVYDVTNDGIAEYYKADVVTANDYYPGGMDMPGRQYNAATGYRYGFNGKEEDKESPVQYDYGFRIYDPRLVRFKSVDPLIKKYPELTPYQFASNRPIDGVDLDGLEYVKRIHYVGYVDSKLQITHTKDIMYYQMDNKMILAHGGTPAGSYNAAAYGPEGKGIKHEYYFEDGIEALKPRWDSRQNDTRGEIAFHGLYSGPGSITKGGINSTNYDFSFKPIDASDAIAKRHDMNYSKDASNNYQGFIEDTRTLAADNQMVKEVQAFLFVNSPLNLKPTNAPTPAGETMASAASQLTMIGALARYKTWKIERMESLGLNKNNTDHMQDSRVTLENYKVSWFRALISPKAAVQRATYQLLKASK